MSVDGRCWVWCLVALALGAGTSSAAKPLVLLVADGFRWDYQELLPKNYNGSLHMLQTEGVRAKQVHPIFPSVSYASWTSIVTGHWAETHGIVGNNMIDQQLGRFTLFNSSLTGLPGWWNAGSDPIWVTATEHGIKTAVIGFSRCDVPVHGVKPAYCTPFGKTPDSLQQVKDHLALAIEKISSGFKFVIVYAEHLDYIGHSYGPGGSKIRKAIKTFDEELKTFFDELKQRKKLDEVNFVMVGDHGMTEVDTGGDTNTIYLDRHLSPLLADHIIERGAYTQIIPGAVNRQRILAELEKMPNVTVYGTKDEFPAEWHYSDHPRIPDILVMADPGSVIIGTQTDNMLPRDAPGAWDSTRGIHGYTRNMTDMATVFYGRGPGFDPGHKQGPMELVDVYQVLAHLLEIEPQPHNGTWDTVHSMLSPAAAPRPALGGAALLIKMSLASLVSARIILA